MTSAESKGPGLVETTVVTSLVLIAFRRLVLKIWISLSLQDNVLITRASGGKTLRTSCWA
jgi:hypothetical protein